MKKVKRVGLIVMVVLNLIVLLGQVWPEGAPPFAKTVNIAFLSITLIYFIISLLSQKPK